MAVSTAPTVKAAILTGLALEAGLSGVQLEYAAPSVDAMQQECIFFGSTELDEVAANIGNSKRDENYVLHLIVNVLRDGDEPQTAEERMWTLVGVVETYLNTNKNPGSCLWAQIAGIEQTPIAWEGKRGSEADIRIAVRGRK